MAAIAANTVKEIASKKRDDGCLLVAKELGLGGISMDEASQQVIMVDYLYDTLMFCVTRGFPWDQVSTIYSLAHDLIVASKDKTLLDAVRMYRESCSACQDKISPQNIKIFTDYLFETFFVHYNLYQHVFSRPQERQTLNLVLGVETMPEVPCLSDGTEIVIYTYEKTLQNIDELNDAKQLERAKLMLTMKAQCDMEVNKAIADVEDKYSSDKDALIELIRTVTAAHISAASNALAQTVEETMAELDYQLERTVVPRPVSIGPPPRMSIKKTIPVMSHKSAAMSKSAKSKGKGKNK